MNQEKKAVRMTQANICEMCNVHPLKHHKNGYIELICIRCRNVEQNKKNRLNGKNTYSGLKLSKPIPNKKCIFCDYEFSPINFSQKQCGGYECKQKQNIQKEQEKFLKDNPEKPRQDLQTITYSFFRKKYGVSKKFTACRG